MKKVMLALLCMAMLWACTKPSDDTTEGTTEPPKDATPPQAEFADPKYSEMTKQALDQLAQGNVEAFGNSLADSAIYYWNSGDSVAMKSAIVNYWKDRRGKVIDTISYVDDIWFSIRVNKPQKGPDAPGVWVLGWTNTSVTYQNGKSIRMWIHTDYHFNKQDKIDRIIQYIDRAVINAALASK